MPRTRIALLPALLIALVLGLAPGAAQARPTLRFHHCPQRSQAGYDCATLRVPLDRSGRVPGTVRLHVERLRQPGRPPGTLLNIEGGPGGAASGRSQRTKELLAPLLDRYRLVLVDPRGTGLSRPFLRCPPASGACARRLGRAARFYTTADNVADLDAVRRALGARRVFLYGTSYGTFVAQQYARAHPAGTERIVLDSPLPPAGIDPLSRRTFASVARVLRQLCGSDACARDTGRLAARGAGAGPAAFSALMAGDEDVALRAFYPAAIRAALRGDHAPLHRLLRLGRLRLPARFLNPAVNTATLCSDGPDPWPASAPPHARARALRRAIARLPVGVFPRSTMLDTAVAWTCVHWPGTDLPRAVTRRPAPAVPALVLVGEQDLRTSVADARAVARAFPRSQVMAVPNRAHGVLRNDVACGRQALEAFVAGRRVGNPCGAPQPVLPLQPVPPRRLTDVHAGRFGRVATAAQSTLADARAVARIAPRAAGLRSGRQRLSGGTLHLDALVYVPGVQVTGWATATDGRLTVRANATVLHLRVLPGGRVSRLS